MAWDKQVPFAEDGTMITYAKSPDKGYVAGFDRIATVPVVWKDNFTFKTVLKLESITRGQSAARFLWSDKNGQAYEMFMKDMMVLVKSEAVIERGCCDTEWTYIKRGTNFGVRRASK